MLTLQEISEQAAAAHEACVRESIEIDYAYKVGKLHDWVDQKYKQLMKAAYGNDGTTGSAGGG